jgi:hypothetical protein
MLRLAEQQNHPIGAAPSWEENQAEIFKNWLWHLGIGCGTMPCRVNGEHTIKPQDKLLDIPFTLIP